MVKIAQREGLPKGREGTDATASAASDAGGEGTTLDRLRPGQAGTVIKVEAEAALKLHLMELGFVAGSPIVFLMSTPFGDPNIYALRGTSIALRKSEAKCIRIRI
ncbi:MAG: FeoA domain-containing protein [Fibrobacteres bacterium]|nr:FeoA domain-containing protein [Fibrobacterota bacterium]